MDPLRVVLDNISEWMLDMKQDLTKQTMDPENEERLFQIYDLFFDISKEEKQEVGDRLSQEGGGKILTEYMRILTNGGSEVPSSGCDNFERLKIVRGLCWNYSDASLNFCLELGKAQAFCHLADDLLRYKESLEDGLSNPIITSCLSILHNCAKVPDNREYLKEAKVLEAVLPFSKIEKERFLRFKVIAILTLSYIMDDKEGQKLLADKSIISFNIRYLQKAVDSRDHGYDGFSAAELVKGVTNLASHDGNKITIVEEGVLPMLVKLMEMGDESEKELSSKAVWTLSFATKNIPYIKREKNMKTALEKLEKEKGEKAHAAQGALWCLYREEGHLKASWTEEADGKVAAANTKTATSKQGTSPHAEQCKHIMISYNWDHQNIMLRIKDRLKECGYKIWIDVERMSGSTLDAMAEAVENSIVVLMSVSRKYKESQACRTEAGYVYKRKIHYIPIIVEQDYDADGWLGLLQGAKLYYDFSREENFESSFSGLLKEIGDKGKHVGEDETDGASQMGESIEKWTTDDVENWAIDNRIPVKFFGGVNGESLAHLHRMRKTSVSTYDKYVLETMEMTKLEDMKNLSRGLDSLKI